jgi:hypothetical protein
MKVTLRLTHEGKARLPTLWRHRFQPACQWVRLVTLPRLQRRPRVYLGRLGWALAGVSILVGFVLISGATGVDREDANNRRVDSFIPEQATMFESSSDLIKRDSPTPIVDDIIHSQQSHATASIPQQSALGEEKDTLDGKEVRKAVRVQVQKTTPIQPADRKRAD